MSKIEILSDRRFAIAESPVWHVEEQRLYWIAGRDGEIWSCRPDGSDPRHWSVGHHIGSMVLREGGGAVVGLRDSIGLYDFASGDLETVVIPGADLPGVQLNDGKADSRGRFIVGALDLETLANPEAKPRGRLYRLDADRTVHVLAEGIAIANGPCWSLDNSTFYFTDSAAAQIYAYDWNDETGVAERRRAFATCRPGELPDGATVDAEDHYWCAINGLNTGVGEVRRIAPDGRVVHVIEMPTAKTTSLAFGGPDLDTLYVTSMSAVEGARSTPNDGAVFAIRGLGVRGRPPHRYKG